MNSTQAHEQIKAHAAVVLAQGTQSLATVYGVRDEAGVWYSFTYGFSPVAISRTDPYHGWVYRDHTTPATA